MRLVFAGTPEFAIPSLAALIAANHDVVMALTRPDRPAGRGMRETPSPVKRLAQEHGIEVFQPSTLKTGDAQRKIAEVEADVMVVAAYGSILSQGILDLPRLGCINVHASLLPRWRGAAPIHRAILAGDRETGITIMKMTAGLDTGPMLSRGVLRLADDDTAGTLHDKLAKLGGELIVHALRGLETGAFTAAEQPAEGVTYAEKITKQEAAIVWTLPASDIERRVRAFNPYPVAQTQWRGETLRIWKAVAVANEVRKPGLVSAVEQDRIIVSCGEGAIGLLELQRAGGKRLAARDFLQGATVAVGERLGN
ncbi:MAG: methionyl-tRNA formyltransferase [Pseudomonadota bacterium]|nr:methionyl-tRNA formyltransferase [Pseudomonadota bacterium]